MSLADALWRAGLRGAWIGLQGWWWLRRPRLDAAAVVVRVGERMLLVRNSYQPRLTLPGGRLGAREEPARGAARELREEVGLHVEPEALRPILDRIFRHGFITNRVALYELRLEKEPALRLDRREVVAAHYLTEEEARRELLWPPLATWLEERAGGAH